MELTAGIFEDFVIQCRYDLSRFFVELLRFRLAGVQGSWMLSKLPRIRGRNRSRFGLDTESDLDTDFGIPGAW